MNNSGPLHWLKPLMALSLLAAIAAPCAGAPSAQFRNDPGHDGYIAQAISTPFSLLWRYTTAAPGAGGASPIAANDLIYIEGGQYVFALHPSDGTVAWQFPAAGAGVDTFDSTPCVDNGAVYAGSEGSTLYKLDAMTGALDWSQKLQGALRGAPAASNGVVYVGDSANYCTALSEADGSAIWSRAAQGTVTASPIVSPNFIYFASADDSIYCITKSGKLQWAAQFASDPSQAPPALSNGILYVAAGTDLYAVDAQTGKTNWQQVLGQVITSSPVVGPDSVMVGTVDGNFSAFTKEGHLKWRDSLGYPSYGYPLLTSNAVLVPCSRGVLYCLDSTNGKLDWEYAASASIAKKEARPDFANLTTAPLLADGTLYLMGDDGSLSALRNGAIDQLPPVVSQMTPAPGSASPGTNIYPSAVIADYGCGVNPSTVSMTLDGEAISNIIYDAAKKKADIDAASAAGGGPVNLADGSHEITVTASDWLGHTVTQSWGFFVDNSLDNNSNNQNSNNPNDNPTQ